MQDAGLKVNAPKLFFCTAETEYLGYIFTRGGVKPQEKKLQAILAISPPNTVTELRRFLRMVQYYCDMWVKRSEMLAPLTDLVGECGETKPTKKNKIKKKPWRLLLEDSRNLHQRLYTSKGYTAQLLMLSHDLSIT